MDKEREQNSELSRRKLLKSTAAAGLAVSIGVGSESQTAAAVLVGDNPIRKENAKTGTRDWLLTKTDITKNEPVKLWRSPRIEGYCSATSVSAGDTLKIMVSTNPVSEFNLEIYRTGYYGGTGGRFMKRFRVAEGQDPARSSGWQTSSTRMQVGTFRGI